MKKKARRLGPGSWFSFAFQEATDLSIYTWYGHARVLDSGWLIK